MDLIDINILKLLQKNSRISASEISNQVKLSVSAVGERLKKLENSSIIKQYTTILNAEVLQKELTAMMFVSLERPQFIDKFLKFIQLEDEILECHYLAGDYDYILKIITRNTMTLEQLLNNIKSVPGVIKTKTIVALGTVKNNYSITIEADEL